MSIRIHAIGDAAKKFCPWNGERGPVGVPTQDGHFKSLHVHSYPPRVISGPKIPISITHPWSRCVGTRIALSTTRRTGEQGPFGTAVISPPVSSSPLVRQHFGPG